MTTDSDLLQAFRDAITQNYSYETEYDGRMYTLCIHCQAQLSERQGHNVDCITRRIPEIDQHD